MYQLVMKKRLSVLVLALVSVLPSISAAQQTPLPIATEVPGMHIPTQAERESGKTAVLSALSADHRAKILAIVGRVNGGQLTDFRGAEQQIDAILSPEEVKALLAIRDSMRHAQKPNSDPIADAGRFLLRLLITPEKLQELRLQIQRSQHKP
jgi:hypothetical protein